MGDYLAEWRNEHRKWRILMVTLWIRGTRGTRGTSSTYAHDYFTLSDDTATVGDGATNYLGGYRVPLVPLVPLGPNSLTPVDN